MLRAEPTGCWHRLPGSCRKSLDSSPTASGISRRCGTTKISATTRVNAKRQQVQILFARWKQAESWFNPELLQIPLATVREWMNDW